MVHLKAALGESVRGGEGVRRPRALPSTAADFIHTAHPGCTNVTQQREMRSSAGKVVPRRDRANPRRRWCEEAHCFPANFSL